LTAVGSDILLRSGAGIMERKRMLAGLQPFSDGWRILDTGAATSGRSEAQNRRNLKLDRAAVAAW